MPTRLLPTLRLATALGLVFLGLAALGSAGCEVLGSPSRVKAGQLYVSGQARYDTYFAAVHLEQAGAAKWAEERKAARKPLVEQLRLPADASDDTIAQATRDHLSTGTLRLDVSGAEAHVVPADQTKQASPRDLLAAIEQTARTEADRSQKLRDLPGKLDQLAKQGHDLEGHIGEDFGKQAGQKPFEVKEEIDASLTVLGDLAHAAQRESKTAGDFLLQLQRAVAAGSEVPAAASKEPSPPPAPHPPAHHPKPKKPEEPASSPAVAHSEPPAAPKPKAQPPATPKPQPKPAAAEVFQP